MPAPLIIAAAAASGGLSTGVVVAIASGATAVGTAIGTGISFLFGRGKKEKPPEDTSDKQKEHQKREEQRKQKEREGMEKAQRAEDVRKNMKKKTAAPYESVYKAGQGVEKAAGNIDHAISTANNANGFFSKEFPKLKKDTQIVQQDNGQLLQVLIATHIEPLCHHLMEPFDWRFNGATLSPPNGAT